MMQKFPNHLIAIEDLSQEQILQIFALAKTYLITNNNPNSKITYRKSELLKHKTIFNLFFEPSTRTRATFELAAKNLSANVININLDESAIKKGESIKDTILTIKAMQADGIVIRHKKSGIARAIANLCDHDLTVINAGDGTNSHPSQGLLDVFTILQYKPNLNDLKIVIVGDILHSRVARSQIATLHKLGCTNIHIIGPENLLPKETSDPDNLHNKDYILANNLVKHSKLKVGIKNADIICCLRLQKERMQHTAILNDEDYFNNYGISEEILALANKDALVLHPGPINRDVEICSKVAYGKQSVILQQVTNGIAIRMAIFELFLQ